MSKYSKLLIFNILHIKSGENDARKYIPWIYVIFCLFETDTGDKNLHGDGLVRGSRALGKDRGRFEEDFREVRQQCGSAWCIRGARFGERERATVARIREQTKSPSATSARRSAARLVHIDAEREGLGDARAGSICPFAFSRCACSLRFPGSGLGCTWCFSLVPVHLPSPHLVGERDSSRNAEERHARVNLNSAMLRPCWPAQCRHRSFRRPCPILLEIYLLAREPPANAAPRCCRRCLARATHSRGMLLAFASRKSPIRRERFRRLASSLGVSVGRDEIVLLRRLGREISHRDRILNSC